MSTTDANEPKPADSKDSKDPKEPKASQEPSAAREASGPKGEASSTLTRSRAELEELERIRRLAFIRRRLRRTQNQFARLLGVSRWDRDRVVGEMLKRHRSDVVSYWLQLFLSMGIATLGLVLNSTGVVIGAMLISPLMGPIVGLGMGLAVGSPFLTLRSLVRMLSSIGGVILAAAFLTMLLPFHEVTSEIAARTSPTVLDLTVAAFCALAAGFTTARQSNDTAAAAAGTAIGISLVPPLCVSGFGLGTAQAHVFGGALLLFTANLCAILFFSVVLFVALGFNMVDVHKHEAEDIDETGPIAEIALKIRRLFGTRYGPVLRFLMPALLIAAVYVPLRVALRDVAWEVQVRSDIHKILEAAAPPGSFVRTQSTIEKRRITIRLVMMGAPEQARALEDQIETQVAAVSGVIPTVQITAVPDYTTLRQVADSITAPVPEAVVNPAPDLDELARRVGAFIDERWPASAGALLEWDLEFTKAGAPRIELTHAGDPIGGVAEALIADALSTSLEGEVAIREHAVAVGVWNAEGDLQAWLPRLIHALNAARELPGLHACVYVGPDTRKVPAPPIEAPPPADGEEPLPPPPRFLDVSDPAALAAHSLLDALPGPRIQTRAGPRWAVELGPRGCPELRPAVTPPPADDVAPHEPVKPEATTGATTTPATPD